MRKESPQTDRELRGELQRSGVHVGVGMSAGAGRRSLHVLGGQRCLCRSRRCVGRVQDHSVHQPGSDKGGWGGGSGGVAVGLLMRHEEVAHRLLLAFLGCQLHPIFHKSDWHLRPSPHVQNHLGPIPSKTDPNPSGCSRVAIPTRPGPLPGPDYRSVDQATSPWSNREAIPLHGTAGWPRRWCRKARR